MRSRDWWRSRLPGLGLAVIVALTVSGCVQIPDSGPVREAPDPSGVEPEVGSYYDPSGPRPGESAHDIVLHFLDAMQAAPMRTDIAREFLSSDARASWEPQVETIVYTNRPAPQGSSPVTLVLEGANRLDASGAWRGALSRPRARLEFPMIKESGEWRIAEAPNALIVPNYWFDQWFARHNVYFFEPTGRFLVPQPVYVPKGEQLPTALLSSLLDGPGEELSTVLRSFVSPDLRLDLSVPVVDGVADVTMMGDPAQVTEHSQELMLAQIAWTLRADPSIRAFRVSVGGEQLTSGDGSSDFVIGTGADFDPNGLAATSQLFGLSQGLLVSGSLGRMAPVSGYSGSTDLGWSSVAIDPMGVTVAGVSGDRTSVMTSPVRTEGEEATQVVSGARELLKPAWDLAGRLWLVDRRRRGALVSVVTRGRARRVEAPGISGTDVKRFLVSRDGTRLVALVAGARRDRVVVSRLEYDRRGRVRRALPARSLAWSAEESRRTIDIAWHTSSSVSVAYRYTSDYSRFTSLSVDGSPGGDGNATTTVRGRLRRVVSSPVASDPVYVVLKRGVVPLADLDSVLAVEGLEWNTVTYAG